jgi:hypothetical protein
VTDAVAPSLEAAGGAPHPGGVALDEVMLAMDVVDTLRHRQVLVEQELQGEAREAALIERLRATYAAQGIDVPERVLAAGVAALREDRFAYRPPPPGFATTLARLYVHRASLAALVIVVVAVVALAWGVRHATVVAPRQALAADLGAVHARVSTGTDAPEALQRAASTLAAGEAALERGDTAAARDALAALESLAEVLEQRYELLIAAGPNAVSGVWRVPDVNTAARNYYLIVEARDDGGRPVRVEITNEETGRVERASTWGLRVPQEVFERVAADKAADGIIQDRLVGTKRAGTLAPEYVIPTSGGAITRW